jgi:MFS family permease
VGTTYLSKYDQKIRRSEIVRTSLLILATVFISVPLLIPLLNFWLARTIVTIAFFFAGLGYIGSLVPSLTYIQTHTPENMTGRVLGYFWFVSSIIGILPVLFSATITEVFGVRILLVTFGVVALSASIFLRFYFPKQFATTS